MAPHTPSKHYFELESMVSSEQEVPLEFVTQLRDTRTLYLLQSYLMAKRADDVWLSNLDRKLYLELSKVIFENFKELDALRHVSAQHRILRHEFDELPPALAREFFNLNQEYYLSEGILPSCLTIDDFEENIFLFLHLNRTVDDDEKLQEVFSQLMEVCVARFGFNSKVLAFADEYWSALQGPICLAHARITLVDEALIRALGTRGYSAPDYIEAVIMNKNLSKKHIEKVIKECSIHEVSPFVDELRKHERGIELTNDYALLPGLLKPGSAPDYLIAKIDNFWKEGGYNAPGRNEEMRDICNGVYEYEDNFKKLVNDVYDDGLLYAEKLTIDMQSFERNRTALKDTSNYTRGLAIRMHLWGETFLEEEVDKPPASENLDKILYGNS